VNDLLVDLDGQTRLILDTKFKIATTRFLL